MCEEKAYNLHPHLFLKIKSPAQESKASKALAGKSLLEVRAVEKFEDMGLKPELLKGILEYGFKTPSQIQSQAIPLINQR